MKKHGVHYFVACMGFILLLAACASKQPQVTAAPAEGAAKGAAMGTVEIPVKASNFKFEPNNIKAFVGSTVVFQVENLAAGTHNFSIKDPQGKVIANVDLPAHQTVPVKVELKETGLYEIYCDKPFHPGLGMTGTLEVVVGP